MDIGFLLLALALLLLVAAFVARPILDRAGEREDAPGPAHREANELSSLLTERESILTTLRDLDFDHATGKTADEDYQPQRAALVARGVEILRQLDGLGANGHGPRELEDEIEAAISARRKSQSRPKGAPTSGAPTRDCHNCRATARAGDKFCPNCGAALALACPNCGQPHIAGDKFCGKCGTRLSAPAEA